MIRAAVGLVLLCACNGGSAPPAVPPSGVLPAAPAAAPTAATPAPRAAPAPAFAALRDRVFDELMADDPTTARDLGLHEYDGRVAPLSRAAIQARVERLKRAGEGLAAVSGSGLSDDEALDLAELRREVATTLFWLVDVDTPAKSPQFYEALFSVNTFVDRQYLPLEQRAQRLVAHEEAALAEVPHVRENLTLPLSKPVAEVAARNYAGFATYLRHDVARFVGQSKDEALRARFARSNEALAKAAEELGAWLKVEAARGDQSHVLGPQRYAELLRVQEGLNISLADFETMNEANLEANKRAYEVLATKVTPRPVTESEYFAQAARLMDAARAFVIEHHIVTLATTDAAVVRETPPYMRWNSASIDLSGPFDAARSAFYYLTLPDRSWPKKEREEYLGTMGDLLGTTVHEVYPGHFVQSRWQERAPTRVQKASADYAFVEGWAHYGEQLMIDEGFGADDKANELAMLRGALLRNCRFAVSVGMHTQGMTVEQAAKRFVVDCHQDEATAREQAARGTFDPGYFAYTLGKLQILALRNEARRKLGERFSLERFHDALLSHGALPVALLHDRVLRELGAR